MKIVAAWLAIYVTLFAGCSTAPDIKVCIGNVKRGGGDCATSSGDVFVPWKKMDKWIMLPNADAQTLLEWLKRKANKKK